MSEVVGVLDGALVLDVCAATPSECVDVGLSLTELSLQLVVGCKGSLNASKANIAIGDPKSVAGAVDF